MLHLAERLRLGTAAAGAALICIAAAYPAEARAADHLIVAELAQPAAKTKLLASDVVWRCDRQSCATTAGLTTVPHRFCVRFVREAGDVVAFRINETAFSDDQLAQCNAAAD
jgi:hypothetical protein